MQGPGPVTSPRAHETLAEVAWPSAYRPFVEARLASGEFASADALLEAALKALQAQQSAGEPRLSFVEAELRAVTDALPVLIAYVDKDYIYRFVNSHYEDWFGLAPAQIVGHHVRELFGETLFRDRVPLMARALRGETVQHEASIPHKDGRDRTADVRYMPRTGSDGSISGFHILVFDVGERVEREAALKRHIAHRERAEAQLRQLNESLEIRIAEETAIRCEAQLQLAQAQKMETIGKLTGGVAHDFNNLLQVVSGNLQMLARDVSGRAAAERRVANALAGVSRGAKLSSQLLAFARRQPLQPRVVNPTRLVVGMDDMLRRTIGDAVVMDTSVGKGIWNSFIDPVQLENALLNLAINARDAMDGHGRLTIELANATLDEDYARAHAEVSAGQYVMLAVSDTGTGMSAETISRAIEPFFSTKGEGKGSGLGLSMVYGFVKQSGGHLKIYSEVGEGTTVRLYLPRADQPAEEEIVVDHGPVTGGTETILVVEDDEAVRSTVVELLTDLGYKVLKAVDAASALSVIESGAAIDMLFTDIVMPGTLKSPELARKARERLPHLAVLFTSGYTENSIMHGGKLDAGVELLSKPYTREALARKIRHVLLGGVDQSVEAGPVPEQEKQRVLLVEDDELVRAVLAETIAETMLIWTAASAEEALTILRGRSVDTLVTDLNLPGQSGLELVAAARALHPGLGVVIASGEPVAASGNDPSIRYIQKPFDRQLLLRMIGAARGYESGSRDEREEPLLASEMDGGVGRG